MLQLRSYNYPLDLVCMCLRKACPFDSMNETYKRARSRSRECKHTQYVYNVKQQQQETTIKERSHKIPWPLMNIVTRAKFMISLLAYSLYCRNTRGIYFSIGQVLNNSRFITVSRRGDIEKRATGASISDLIINFEELLGPR